MKSGFWQVTLHPDNIDNTALSTGQGLRQFTLVHFDPCKAPASFQRLVESVLRGLTDETCLVNLYDVIVVGRRFKEELENLWNVV